MVMSVTRSLVDIKAARETRTSEALKIKDDQIRILTEQNNKLLEAIEKGEEEISAVQLEKLHVDEENRQLRENVFEVQSKAKVEAGELETLRNETDEREQKLRTISAQHTEILKLLENEETKCVRLTSDLDCCQSELRDLKVQHTSLVSEAKSTRDDLQKSTKSCHLQSEEIRLLRTEVETVKNKKHEEAMKSSVEIESLQEQLRVRKEKQYQLLEKLQSQEESRRRAEDQVSSLEEKVKSLHSKSLSTETQLQLEISSKLSQADLNKKLAGDNEILATKNKEITSKLQVMEEKQVKMDADARTNGEKLREMAEKVFQLLERLKLAELGKTRSMEALRNKEDEVHSLKKKLANLVKEHARESKARAQIQSERKALDDQIKDLKKHNQQLGLRCKEEARLKVRFDDERKDAEAKIRTLNSRISFLLNKLEADEKAKNTQKEEMENLQSRAESLHDTNCALQDKLDDASSKLKATEEDLREKEQNAEGTRIKLEALQQLYDEQDELREETKNREFIMKGGGENPLLAGGRLRFFVEKKSSLGLFALKAKCAKDRHWLDENNCNMFMKKMSKSTNRQDLLLNKIAEIYGIILTREEDIEKLSSETEEKNAEIDKLSRKLSLIHDRLSVEEESKRRTLLKYINAVKASVSLGEDGCEKTREEVGSIGAGIIRLPEVSVQKRYSISMTPSLSTSSSHLMIIYRHV